MTEPTKAQAERMAAFSTVARQMSSGLEQFMSEQAILARYTKLRYEAFVKAGFEPYQAIQLCR